MLDMGCGEGQIIQSLLHYGHALHGFDLPDKSERLQAGLGPIFGRDYPARIRTMADERVIPFDAAMFDVVYSNQVFEHVRFLDAMLSECARVLKPEGWLVALFPLATYPIEGHVRVPFAHWIPAGTFRRRYLRASFALGIGRRLPALSASACAAEWDDRLRLYTFYRFLNEFDALFDYYFHEWRIDTADYVRAKVDLLESSSRLRNRLLGRTLGLFQGRWLAACVTHGFNAAFLARRPRHEATHRGVLAWRSHGDV